MAVADQPPPNCRRSCKGVDLPYPFGIIGDPEGCYMLPDFGFSCDNSSDTPTYSNPNAQIPVAGIILPQARMRVMMSISWDCYNRSSVRIDLDPWNMSMNSTPYTMSTTQNVFTAVGCDTSAKILIGNNNYGGCISGCNSVESVDDKQCSGIGCCEASIPGEIKWYKATFVERDKNSTVARFSNCSYSFLVEKGNYTFRKADLTSISQDTMLSLVLDWVVDNRSCVEAKKNRSSYACVSSNSDCVDSDNGPGYFCNCSSGYQGNPYLLDGCLDIDECGLDRGQYPCYGICTNTAGSYNCTCPDGFNSTDPKKLQCTPIQSSSNQKLPLGIKLLIGIGAGLFSLFIVAAFLYVGLQKRKLKKLREMFFRQNGGAVLQQTLLTHRGSTFKIFTAGELESATNNFHRDQIVGRGGFGTVYKGTLPDGTMIAIKRSSTVDEKRSRDFANEVFIISQINHKNIVKLLGCCLEVEVPMLIYEYISNGTLFNYLHSKRRHVLRFPLGNRLMVAVEAAQALKYLHTDASPPILHGDVKSSNILLDGNFTAKVSDFGTSTLAPKDKSEFTTLIQGTYGYLDPEYLQSSQLTDKSDVYSFGVVLVELLTRKLPINFDAPEEERSLAAKFISCMHENRLQDVLDTEIVQEGLTGHIQVVAGLALRCLSLKGDDRPTMRDVAAELEGLQEIQVHPWASPNQEAPPSQETTGLITYTSTHSYDASAAYDIQSGR